MAFPKLPKFGKSAHTTTDGTASTTTGTTVTDHHTGTHAETHAGPPKWAVFPRFLQVVLAIIILGLCAYEINVWRKDLGCSSPARVTFNIVATVLALLFLAYHILSSSLFRVLPAVIFAQIPMDFIMFIFFIAAAATSKYTYDDIYNNCSAYDYYSKRDILPREPKGGRGGGSSSRGGGSSRKSGGSSDANTTTARQGLNAVLGLTFLATLVLSAFFFATKGGGLKSFGKKSHTTAPAAGATAGAVGSEKPIEGHNGAGTQQPYPNQNQAYPQQQYPQQQYPQTTGGTDPAYNQQYQQPAQQQYPQTTGGTAPGYTQPQPTTYNQPDTSVPPAGTYPPAAQNTYTAPPPTN